MAFGADDVQAACGEYLLVQGRVLVFERLNACGFFIVAQCFIGHDELRLYVDIAAEDDVGATAGHVGGDGDHTWAASLRDDERFTFVLFGIEHAVRDVLLIEQVGQLLGQLNRCGAHQRGLTAFNAFFDVNDDGGVFFFGGAED